MPYLNPARSLGPSFVLNHWDNHWVYWFGPVAGGIVSGLIYTFAFDPKRSRSNRSTSLDGGDSRSVDSDEDTYDDLDGNKGNGAQQQKFHTGSAYNTYRPALSGGSNTYCPSLATASLYSAPASKLDRVESLYGGTKSLYCKSPPLTRANLNRSQSVYTKSNSALNRELLPRPGPLVPAQSLYPMRLNQQQQAQQHIAQNQNAQNTLYGARRAEVPGGYNNGVYGTRANPVGDVQPQKYEEGTKFTRGNRPESVYGTTGPRRGQSTQSDDSSYGSYQGSTAQNSYTATGGQPTYIKTTVAQRPSQEGQVRQPPQIAPPTHHAIRQPQQSPNPQY